MDTPIQYAWQLYQPRCMFWPFAYMGHSVDDAAHGCSGEARLGMDGYFIGSWGSAAGAVQLEETMQTLVSSQYKGCLILVMDWNVALLKLLTEQFDTRNAIKAKTIRSTALQYVIRGGRNEFQTYG